MPSEIIILGAALIFGAWFVLDQRSLGEKMGLLLTLAFLYIGFRWLSGDTMSDIFSPVTQFFSNFPPPTNENP